MKSSDDWQRVKYDTVFGQVYALIERRRASDPQFTLEALERLLETQYVNLGNQPAVKGTVQELVDAATTAALEAALAQWQQELADGDPGNPA